MKENGYQLNQPEIHEVEREAISVEEIAGALSKPVIVYFLYFLFLILQESKENSPTPEPLPSYQEESDDDDGISEKQKKNKRLVKMISSQVTSTKCSILQLLYYLNLLILHSIFLFSTNNSFLGDHDFLILLSELLVISLLSFTILNLTIH